MKIIKNNYQNKNYDKPRLITCELCKSVLEITEADIQVHTPNRNDRFDEYYRYTTCACCGVATKL